MDMELLKMWSWYFIMMDGRFFRCAAGMPVLPGDLCLRFLIKQFISTCPISGKVKSSLFKSAVSCFFLHCCS